MCSDPFILPSNPLTVDARPSATNKNEMTEVVSSGSESVPKARKPYTITKQREKWTEEEHNKFIEALKLHGRAWQRIEEHVGTKTAVQIRSHAQKFFSKVVSESSANGASSVKPVEIPPPRPKRKPLHPYPRKSSSVRKQEVRILKRLDKSPLPFELVYDQERNSPKSVLSAFSSGLSMSSASNIPNYQILSDSSSSVSNTADSEHSEQEIRCNSAASASAKLTMKIKSDTEPIPISRITSFQLFGRTVVVKEPLANDENSHNEKGIDVQIPFLTQKENTKPGRASSDNTSIDTWNLWSCSMPPFSYSVPSQQELVNVSQHISTPMPLLAVYSGIAFPIVQTSGLFSQQHPLQAYEELSSTKEVGENSWSDSNTTTSIDGPGRTENICDSVDYNQVQRKPISVGVKSSLERQIKGFLPYKRSLSGREQGQLESNTDEQKESQRIKLSL